MQLPDDTVQVIVKFFRGTENRRFGLSVEFIAVKNAGHDFGQIGNDPISPSVEIIHQRTVDFFRRYLASAPLMETER